MDKREGREIVWQKRERLYPDKVEKEKERKNNDREKLFLEICVGDVRSV